MTLHKQAKEFLRNSAQFAPVHTLSPEKFREVAIATAISETYDIHTEDHQLDGPHGMILVRVYRPQPAGALPVIVFYHGGGFVINDVEAVDPMCRKLAAKTGYAIVSVDYRKAPEYKFPVPVEEALYALEWVYEHANALGLIREKIVVAGESAGGNLAAVVSQLARDNGGPNIAYQILICPLVDWSEQYESKKQYESGYFLEKATLDYFAGHYLREEADRLNPLASPIIGNLAGLPPALLITAQYDPLRDEGEKYGIKLMEHGVKVTLKRYNGMIHMFYAMTDLFDDGEDVYKTIHHELGKFV